MPGTLTRLLLTLLLCAASAGTLAAETIVRFISDITINADSTVDVVETITVNAEGNQIRPRHLPGLPDHVSRPLQ